MTKLAEQIRHGAEQAWESLSEGWRELGTRASGALTRFRPGVKPGWASAAGVTHLGLSFWGWEGGVSIQ